MMIERERNERGRDDDADDADDDADGDDDADQHMCGDDSFFYLPTTLRPVLLLARSRLANLSRPVA